MSIFWYVLFRTIRDAIDHAHNMKVSSILSWEEQAEHDALEVYLRHDISFAEIRVHVGFLN